MPPIKKVKKIVPKPVEDESEGVPVISGQLQKKMKKQKQKLDNQRGVVFIKHLPHGFFEEQLKKYFQQFGTVTRVRLVRSKRTGGSKGFAFVEFEYPEVAEVAAETMDNYLMFKKLVKASYIPPNVQRFNYFKTTLQKVKNKAGKEIYISGKTAALQRKVRKHNDWSDNSYQKRTKKNLEKIHKLKKKFAHLGIDFASIIIEPKIVKADEKIEMENETISNYNETDKNTSTDKNKGTSNSAKQPSSNPEKKTKNEVELKDLLGNTIVEDSDDEDWKADGSLTSDEESYGSMEDSEGESEQEDKNKHKSHSASQSSRSSLNPKKKIKKEVELKDLLESTIVEDSDDEDWKADGSLTSDEASYGFMEDSEGESTQEGSENENAVDDDDDDDGDENTDESADEIVPLKEKKKVKISYEKSTKPFRVDRLDEIIKRKPHLGGIQKAGKKKIIRAFVSKAKKSLQVAAVKELSKTKAYLKSKPNQKEHLVKNKKIK